MKKFLIASSATLMVATSAPGALLITGVFDGPLSGGTPKAVELYASTAIADLSDFAVEYWFNANVSPSVTISLTGSVAAGEFIYLTPDAAEFATYFGSGFTVGYSGGSINGDDSIVLTQSSTTIDIYGAPGTDGTGEAWEYLDGWAYRNNGSGPSGTFDISEWTLSGINANDGESTNATAATPFPIGTYVPEPSIALLGGLGILGLIRRRR